MSILVQSAEHSFTLCISNRIFNVIFYIVVSLLQSPTLYQNENAESLRWRCVTHAPTCCVASDCGNKSVPKFVESFVTFVMRNVTTKLGRGKVEQFFDLPRVGRRLKT